MSPGESGRILCPSPLRITSIQPFAGLRVHQNYLEGVLKCRLLGPPSDPNSLLEVEEGVSISFFFFSKILFTYF